MDVSQDKNLADDHNTNQNEATLDCRSIQNVSTTTPQTSKGLDNLDNKPSDNEDDNNKNQGKYSVVSRSNSELDKHETVDPTFKDESPRDQIKNADEREVQNVSSSPVSNDNNPRDENIDLSSDSNCVDAPSDKKHVSNTNTTFPIGSQNDISTVDLSVTSDDDIKVTCRFSSTPVNYSIRKSLNDTDCSMSSVSDTSPISSIEADSKLSSNLQSANISKLNDGNKDTRKDTETSDHGTMMFIQTHPYAGKPGETRAPHSEHEYTSRCTPYYVDRSQQSNYSPQNYQNPPVRPYSTPPYNYPPFFENSCGYNDYHHCNQRSLTDNKNRHDYQVPISPQPDLCCYPVAPNMVSDRDYFVYPSIYVSNAGLISVLLRSDMSVEMTVDRTIRVVSHNHMMAVATDSKGTAASLYHPAVKIFQMGYNTDIATDMFRAKMSQGEAIFFSNGANCFKLQESELQPVAPIKFSDIHRDQSVNLLFSSEGYGESLVATCMQVAAQAEYANLPKGGVIVRINGVKVTQSGCGDVTVVTGAKFIRLSPHNGTTRLGNRFVDIEVERDWSVKLTRGTHSFVHTKKRAMVSNGKMEAGFDENNSLKVINLQSRHPLLAEPNIIRRPGKRMTRPPTSNTSTSFTPRRRVLTPNTGRGGINTC